jgi:endonuclease/exonuclease/phosphatase family metal-dependent hydrolase
VKGENERGVGLRSPRACQRTIAQQGARTGAEYRVVTYNVCGNVCTGWSDRRAQAGQLVAAAQPDVVMLQEAPPDSGMAAAIGGMTQARSKHAKALLYRTDRFAVAKSPTGKPRTGYLDLGLDPVPNAHRWAVWAELLDRQNGDKPVIFVSVHLSAGGDTLERDTQRRKDATKLVEGLRTINPEGLPLVVGGDFNSNQGRTYDSPGQVMSDAGLGSAFFLAESWTRPNYNSATGALPDPKVGATWGYHVDQVWVDPAHTVVEKWANAAQLVDGKYPAPMVSDHAPVLVRLLVN